MAGAAQKHMEPPTVKWMATYTPLEDSLDGTDQELEPDLMVPVRTVEVQESP